MVKTKLAIIATGGTIAASSTVQGAKPTMGVIELMQQVPNFIERFDFTYNQLMQKDSTLIDHRDWIKIAREAHKESSQGKKVLILHGTDTLSYTSSALSFAIQNPQTSIALTGSMKMLENKETDVIKNLSDAAVFLSQNRKGVHVVFNGKVMTASRITKVSSVDINAFETVDNRYVATVEGNVVTYNQELFEIKGNPALINRFDNRVCTLRVTPGLSKDIFDAILQKGFRAINVTAFGTGNIPYTFDNKNPENVLGGLLRKAIQTARKVPVVITSQTIHGGVDLKKYEVGRKIEIPPLISGEDMTQESAHVKLMWCLGQGMSLDEVRMSFEKNYGGEITIL